MNALRHPKSPVLWTGFMDMDREVFIKTQTQTLFQHEETKKCIVRGKQEEEGEVEEKEEEVG